MKKIKTAPFFVFLALFITACTPQQADFSINQNIYSDENVQDEDITRGVAPDPILFDEFDEESEQDITDEVEPLPTTRVLKQEIYEPAVDPEQNCHPSYSGCLNSNASDYDCSGGSGNGPYYTGRVQVIGPDVFDLDRDNDGWGCE